MNVEFDVWWILVGVGLFAAGWFAARVDIKLLVKESKALPGWYFKGLNHLLNNQSDKAIESFVEVVKERPDTLELQFALGQLFRKQGEIERATRIHQELLARPHLTHAHRQRAIYELAQDYNAAGLLDRAEEYFQQLKGTPHEHASLEFLIRIYEMEKDWDKAITATKELESVSKIPYARQLGQYHCERSSAALTKGELERAGAEAIAALNQNKRCARAHHLLGDIAKAKGQIEAAITHWEACFAQDAQGIGLVAQRLAESYETLGRPEVGISQLKYYQAQVPSQDVLNALLGLIRRTSGDASALTFLREELQRAPTLSGVEQFTSLLKRNDDDDALIHDVLAANTRAGGTYPCSRCGFRARTYYWQCPGCVQWESFVPKRQEALDVR
jgi:lipopolysaccharide biosynthesis regulator YciM